MALVNVSKEVPATAVTSMSNLTCYYTVPTTSPPALFAPLACAICFALFFFRFGRRGAPPPTGQRDNGTTGQRDTGPTGQRDNGTPGQRDNGTTGHRANGTPGQRDTGPTGQPTGRANGTMAAGRENSKGNTHGINKRASQATKLDDGWPESVEAHVTLLQRCG